MYSVKNNKLLSVCNFSHKFLFHNSFIVAFCPWHIVSWHFSLVPSFIAFPSLSTCYSHPPISLKPYTSVILCVSHLTDSSLPNLGFPVQTLLPPSVYCSLPKSLPNLYQAPYRVLVLWLPSQLSYTQSSLYIFSCLLCTAPYSSL